MSPLKIPEPSRLLALSSKEVTCAAFLSQPLSHGYILLLPPKLFGQSALRLQRGSEGPAPGIAPVVTVRHS